MTVSFIHSFFMYPCSAAILRFSTHNACCIFCFSLRTPLHWNMPCQMSQHNSLVNVVLSVVWGYSIFYFFFKFPCLFGCSPFNKLTQHNTLCPWLVVNTLAWLLFAKWTAHIKRYEVCLAVVVTCVCECNRNGELHECFLHHFSFNQWTVLWLQPRSLNHLYFSLSCCLDH